VEWVQIYRLNPDVHYAPLGGSNSAKSNFIRNETSGVVGARAANKLPVYKVHIWIVSCTPSNCLRLKRSDSPVFQLDTGTVLLDWQVRACAIWNDG